MLAESGEFEASDLTALATAAEEADGLGLFVRSIVGLDRSAAQDALSEFVADRNLSSRQISFVDLIVTELSRTGAVPIRVLYDPPFDAIAPTGPEDVFTEARDHRARAGARRGGRDGEAAAVGVGRLTRPVHFMPATSSRRYSRDVARQSEACVSHPENLAPQRRRAIVAPDVQLRDEIDESCSSVLEGVHGNPMRGIRPHGLLIPSDAQLKAASSA